MLRHGITIFLGALLVFAVQPILGKYLLPWFGGGPAVWTACLLFFQIALLLGYLWAHALDSWFSPRAQAVVHLSLLGVSAMVTAVLFVVWDAPIMPPDAWKPSGSAWPVGQILLILSLGVGLPYVLLTATSPLLQAWHRDALPDKPPWKLYALSNAGSLLGLLAYPFVIEPNIGSLSQGKLWSGLYLLFIAGMVVCSLPRLRIAPQPGKIPDESAPGEDSAPGWIQRGLWFGLAAFASMLLLAGTNQMSQEVAVIPFLWVLPLALYLVSFILAFESDRLYGRAWFTPLFALAAAASVWALFEEFNFRIGWQVLIYSAVVFAGCMLCHGELARHKPHPRRLTAFYLTVALGGAAGGAFVSLAAPIVFDGYWEFHLALVGVAGLYLLSLSVDKDSWIHGRLRWVKFSIVSLGVLGLAGILGYHPNHYQKDVLATSRNFYGVLRVKLTHPEHPKYHAHDLYDGQILHGYQFKTPRLEPLPTAYFSLSSGLGLALRHHPARSEGRPLSMGLIGLGIGTAAAHGRPGDLMRFYEINPEVIRLARGDGGHFSFITRSQAKIQVVEGDARISLESELAHTGSKKFDVFVVDAFQSDAIPVHLLNLEAFRLYLTHLKDDGLLVVHVTNLNLSLEPVVDRIATELDLVVATVRDSGDGWVSLRSHWMLLTKDPMILADPAIAEKATLPKQLEGPAPLWTDDYSSILPILR